MIILNIVIKCKYNESNSHSVIMYYEILILYLCFLRFIVHFEYLSKKRTKQFGKKCMAH